MRLLLNLDNQVPLAHLFSASPPSERGCGNVLEAHGLWRRVRSV